MHVVFLNSAGSVRWPPVAVRMSISRFAAVVVVCAICLLWSPVASLGDLHRDLTSQRMTASRLRAAIAQETRRIDATGAGLRDARAHLAALQGRVNASQAALSKVQGDLVAARDRLTRLENRMHDASTALAANLVAAYKDNDPDMMTVILNSRGFEDMLERLDFMERTQEHNATILHETKATRVQVLAQTERLQKLQKRDRPLTPAVTRLRN